MGRKPIANPGAATLRKRRQRGKVTGGEDQKARSLVAILLQAAKDHEAAVEDALRALNKAIAAAASDGMCLEAKVLRVEHISATATPFLSVSAKVRPEDLVMPPSPVR